MVRKRLGERPLTPAQKQARVRAKRRAMLEMAVSEIKAGRHDAALQILEEMLRPKKTA